MIDHMQRMFGSLTVGIEVNKTAADLKNNYCEGDYIVPKYREEKNRYYGNMPKRRK